MKSAGVVRLKPKRASRRNVRQMEKGRLKSCAMSPIVAMTATPSQGSESAVRRQRPSMSAMPPPTVNASSTTASTTVPIRPKRTLAIV